MFYFSFNKHSERKLLYLVQGLHAHNVIVACRCWCSHLLHLLQLLKIYQVALRWQAHLTSGARLPDLTKSFDWRVIMNLVNAWALIMLIILLVVLLLFSLLAEESLHCDFVLQAHNFFVLVACTRWDAADAVDVLLWAQVLPLVQNLVVARNLTHFIIFDFRGISEKLSIINNWLWSSKLNSWTCMWWNLVIIRIQTVLVSQVDQVLLHVGHFLSWALVFLLKIDDFVLETSEQALVWSIVDRLVNQMTWSNNWQVQCLLWFSLAGLTLLVACISLQAGESLNLFGDLVATLTNQHIALICENIFWLWQEIGSLWPEKWLLIIRLFLVALVNAWVVDVFALFEKHFHVLHASAVVVSLLDDCQTFLILR